jgi:hypothetical protein
MAILHTGFVIAQNKIEEEIEKHNRLPEEYDTTLTAVIYNGRKIVYGHVGDGGIIGLGSFGDFIKVTEVQKGEEHNMVVPLRGGPDYWVFDYSEEEFCSILLLTDGLLDIMLPSLLKGDIYINYVRQFMDVNKLGLTKDNHVLVSKKIEDYLESDKIDFVTDDKTMVGLINYKLAPQEKEPTYYEEPDWNKLKYGLRVALYEDNEKALNENEPYHKSTDLNIEDSPEEKSETVELEKVDVSTDLDLEGKEELHKDSANNVDRIDSNIGNKNENEKTERPKRQTQPKNRSNCFFSNLFRKIINK